MTRRRLAGPVATLVVGALLAGLAAAPGWAQGGGAKVKAVVLPFAGRVGGPLDEWLAEGAAEALSRGLRGVGALYVQSRPTLERALKLRGWQERRLADEEIGELARAMRVALVVAGTIGGEGDQLVLRIRALDFRGPRGVAYAEEVRGATSEFLPLGLRLARALLGRAKIPLAADDQKRLEAAFAQPTPNLDTYGLYIRGLALERQGTKESLERAADVLSRAVEIDPAFGLAHLALGSVLEAQRNRWKAAGEFRKAIQVAPDLAEAYKRLADTQLQSPRRLYDQAIQSYGKAIELEPGYAEAYVGLGDARQAKGQFDDAIREYTRALAIDPDNAAVHFSLGKIYFTEKNQYHEAVAAYRKAIDLDPTFIEAHLALADILEEKGLYEEAVARYRTALTLQPNHAEAHYGLAIALESVDRKQAILAWERYIVLATDNPTHKEWLEIARRHLRKLREQDK
jgi:tetratricopeptide (TPR) repeat protein